PGRVEVGEADPGAGLRPVLDPPARPVVVEVAARLRRPVIVQPAQQLTGVPPHRLGHDFCCTRTAAPMYHGPASVHSGRTPARSEAGWVGGSAVQRHLVVVIAGRTEAEELSAYRAAGEIGVVQVGVEAARVAVDRGGQGRIDPGD